MRLVMAAKGGITGPNGEKSIQSGIQTAAGQYRIDVPPGDSLGVYEVLIRVTGSSANGGEFELVQGPYTLDYTPLGMMAAAPGGYAAHTPRPYASRTTGWLAGD